MMIIRSSIYSRSKCTGLTVTQNDRISLKRCALGNFRALITIIGVLYFSETP